MSKPNQYYVVCYATSVGMNKTVLARVEVDYDVLDKSHPLTNTSLYGNLLNWKTTSEGEGPFIPLSGWTTCADEDNEYGWYFHLTMEDYDNYRSFINGD